jgi:transposase
VIGLPSLAQLDRQSGTRLWLAAAAADMRCGFDRLAEQARQVTGQDPTGGHFFIFRSRGGDRLKILYFDRDGYALWYKRLEEGVFKLPRIEPGQMSVELRASELAMMLDGIDLRSVKRVKRYEQKNIAV